MHPRPQLVWRRAPRAVGVHIGMWLLLFCVELAMFRRPWLAAVNVCVVFYVFVLVSNAKHQSLREPFIFQDFDYARDMVRHPRLYLPFLGLTRALLGLGAIFGALYLGLLAESSMLAVLPARDFVFGLIVLGAMAIILLGLGAKLGRSVTFDAQTDLRRLGFWPNLFAYALAEKSAPSAAPAVTANRRADRSPHPPTHLPHLVVVQSESFFDLRRQFPLVRRDVLTCYDAMVKTALHYGPLRVPAWGANTVRTEFAFLAGLDAPALGVHRFNPYRKLIRAPFATMATRLQSLGYKTICVHPYPASFYQRDRVFPLLGFDEFWDIRAFNTGALQGPYVGDVALANKVCECLDDVAAQPRFVFVITMENHGPLHLEPAVPATDRRFYLDAVPPDCTDLSAYLRHLVNADCMIGVLRKHLESLARPAWLGWYGDHVPIMPRVYRRMGYPDGTTDYFIWQKGGVPQADARLELDVHALGARLLHHMLLTRG